MRCTMGGFSARILKCGYEQEAILNLNLKTTTVLILHKPAQQWDLQYIGMQAHMHTQREKVSES